MPKKGPVDEQLKQLSDIRKLMLTSLVTALAFVVGLFWRDVVEAAINEIVPLRDTLIFKFLAAVIVTVVVAVFVYILIHGQRIAEERLRELQKSQDRFVKNYKKRLR